MRNLIRNVLVRKSYSRNFLALKLLGLHIFNYRISYQTRLQSSNFYVERTIATVAHREMSVPVLEIDSVL